MTCGTCKHEEVRDTQPCTGCNHGRWWEPKEAKTKCGTCLGDGIDGEDSDGINGAVTWTCQDCKGTGYQLKETL
ncbi:hypothetical protein AEP_00553 [Curvibacter sp. AEP1-3]|nr:hypothetical protein AEP_00553 [Curvibacter sp. AEP1-3]